MSEKQYQTCVITLSDGSVARFTGKAQIPLDTELTIESIRFTEPKDLPDDIKFETLEEVKKNDK